jgi:hypothetical protein
LSSATGKLMEPESSISAKKMPTPIRLDYLAGVDDGE